MRCDQYLPFDEIWCVDFEFAAEDGDNPNPVCLVAHELLSRRILCKWWDELGPEPPYPIGERSLFAAYYASAEMSCHLALGWPMPKRILDLFAEFRCVTNGRRPCAGNSLLGALAHFGLDGIGASEKDDMRSLILSGGPWSPEQKQAILATASLMWRRWPGCCPSWRRRSTYPEPSYGAGTWRRRRRWSATACRSMSTCSTACRSAGPTSSPATSSGWTAAMACTNTARSSKGSLQHF